MRSQINKFRIALLVCTIFMMPFMANAQLFWSGTINLTAGQIVTLNVTLTGDVTINVPVGDYAVISGVISAQGGAAYTVTKTGNGSLRLTGNNTYTGVTTINQGILYIGNDTPTGNIAGNIVTNSTSEGLRFFRSDNFTYNGEISGTGSVHVFGNTTTPNSLTLGGVNTYTGPTSIYAVTLVLSATGSISNSVVRFFNTASKFNISAGDKTIRALESTVVTAEVILGTKTLTIGTAGVNEGDHTYAGKISGTGGIVKTGTGTLFLTSVNTYTGNTTIDQGTLSLATTTGSITNSALVALNGANAKLDISAGNKTIKALSGNNAGAEVILGANTLTIGTSGVNEGNRNYAGKFSGTGSVNKAGTGTLTLSGNSTATGAFNHNAGTVVLNGATWAGTYDKAAGTTLTVTGNPVIGGILKLQGGDINMNLTTTPPSKISVTGAVNASGSNMLNVTATNSVTDYVLINAASGIPNTMPYTPNVPGMEAYLSTANNNKLLLSATIKTNYFVTSSDGVGNAPGTLRWAVEKINNGLNGVANTIDINVSAPITLSSQLLVTPKGDLTILGNGCTITTTSEAVSANLVRFNITGRTLTVERIKFQNCRVTNDGVVGLYGASSNSNTYAYFKNCIFADNISGNTAGAIYINHTRTYLDFCTFYNNTAGGVGGAIYLGTSQARLTLNGALFYGNTATTDNSHIIYKGSGASAPNAVRGFYCVWDKTSYGYTFPEGEGTDNTGNNNIQITDLFFNTNTFAPFSPEYDIVPSDLEWLLDVDFNDNTRTYPNGTAGAVIISVPTYTISASPLNTFGSVLTPYTPPEAQTVTITNTGSGSVTLTQPTATKYDIGTLSTTILATNGATATFTVRPKADLPIGNHDETITISGSNGASATVEASFTVAAEPTYTISASTLTSFGTLETPYTQPEAQTVTITNTGTNSVTLTQPTATNYEIGALSTTILQTSGATATFTVRPKANLPVGNHNEIITINGSNGASTTVEAKFSVMDAPIMIYTVTFAGEEIDIEPQEIEDGNLVVKPEDPERTNYNFGGWFTDNETFLNEWNFETDIVTQDITLYAKWNEKTGVEQLTIDNGQLKIYPNPTSGQLHIGYAMCDNAMCDNGTMGYGIMGYEICDIVICDIMGRSVGTNLRVCPNNGTITIDISIFPAGVYFIQIQTENDVITKKVIKQ